MKRRQSRHPKQSTPNAGSMNDRRQFLVTAAAAAAAGLAWPERLRAESGTVGRDKLGPLLPTRPLGRTGEQVTLLGLGGQHFRRLAEKELGPAIEMSIEGGIRFFDTASMYGDEQLSERLYGEHLTPKYRDSVYLMTKSHARDAAAARDHLERSLKNMKTDVIDLWQVHTLETIEDVDARWNNGVIDVFLKAREEGKIRHIGITCHRLPEVVLHMIGQFAKRGIQIETAQFPVNVCDPAYSSFIEKAIPVCAEHDIAVLAMKTMCGGRLFGGTGEGWGRHGKVSTDPVIPEFLPFRDATDYVWSLPIATRIAGVDNLKQLKENIEAARLAGKVAAERQRKILSIAAEHAGPVREYYKRDIT